ncbi:MAG: hypothetical protein RDU14_04310 [Melioribacteraceae bacterium]|nr:hypothetical protein [Melioribacteraceae bacterium]
MKKLAVLFLILVFSLPMFAQNENEVSSDVPELSEFHDVIYQLWHVGWPEKDTKLLKSLLPEIENGFGKIEKVELKGILQDKKTKWSEGLAELKATVTDYKSAVAKDDTQLLLDAAEKLHTKYEMMVRVVKPMVKEVDAFHQVLYMLYHYYSPEYNFDKIKQAASDLKEKMVDVMKAQLSKRLESRTEKFNSARNELDNAVNAFNDIVAKGDNKEVVIAAVDKVHNKYQELEKVFD